MRVDMKKTVPRIGEHLVVAIDGPAGVGKTTVAGAVADKLSIYHIDTGAMYRALALKAIDEGIDCLREDSLDEIIEDVVIEYIPQRGGYKVLVDSVDVTDRLRTPEVTRASSDIAVHRSVREFMVSLQRGIGERYDITMEGRDIGTVVFPNAQVKIFLTASSIERTRRRMIQDNISYNPTEFLRVMNEIEARDLNDSQRIFAPLRPASDAKIIDTTCLTASEVVGIVIEEVRRNWDTF
ncbi:MAG: cytidylate kinase [Candidatus Coatesbacteria bacterium 4484_99]|uniref:Cytidylate kinase n=1 Tax=Candidatus Coatesbacteria bacterium 4484_99 TaxID=1970774 RepID=A0A1W9S1Q3_9BACT|nr:MAG: cytidylate kinase [Candidatus Coatesbacteria bacterium 4484_99]